MLCERDDVAGARPEWWQLDRVDREPLEEVLAHAPVRPGRVEILVRRGDQPDVHRLWPRAAEPAHLALLECGQELALGGRRQQADLVEKERAAGGQLEEARLGPPGVRERSALVAEQLRLDQVLRDGRAVDVDERRLRPRTESMDEPRDQALTASRLALDQDARRPRRARAREQEPLHVPAYIDHRLALAEQFSTECHPRSPTAVRTWHRAPGSSAGTRGSATHRPPGPGPCRPPSHSRPRRSPRATRR